MNEESFEVDTSGIDVRNTERSNDLVVRASIFKKVNPEGRPTVMTPETIRLLEEAFMMGCTDLEACLYANISKTALYDYQKDNPGFAERKEQLKEHPILLARTTLFKNLNNPNHAEWYLERKRKNEFSTRQELTGADGKALGVNTEAKQLSDKAINEYLHGQETTIDSTSTEIPTSAELSPGAMGDTEA